MQIGYCVLLVLATKPETKKTLVKAVGLSLVLSNFLMAVWAITWVRLPAHISIYRET
jgi:branched-subunit amino acid ABC-type transport system permease component